MHFDLSEIRRSKEPEVAAFIRMTKMSALHGVSVVLLLETKRVEFGM